MRPIFLVTNTDAPLGTGNMPLNNDIPQNAPQGNFSIQSVNQQVLANARTQQAIANGMQVVLVRNNTVSGTPVAQSTVLSPGNNGIYAVNFDGALNRDGSLISGQPVTYSFPALPGTTDSGLTVPASPTGGGGTGGSASGSSAYLSNDTALSVTNTGKVTNTVATNAGRIAAVQNRMRDSLARVTQTKQIIPQAVQKNMPDLFQNFKFPQAAIDKLRIEQPIASKASNIPGNDLNEKALDLLKDIAGKINKRFGRAMTGIDAGKVYADIANMQLNKNKNSDAYYDSKNKLIQDASTLFAGLVASDVLIAGKAMEVGQGIMERDPEYLHYYLNELKTLRANPNISPRENTLLYQEEGRIYRMLYKGITQDTNAVFRQAGSK